MNDELMNKAIENMNECARQIGPILKEMIQKLTALFQHIAAELGLIQHRYKYHTKRVAIRKMQLRRLRKRCAIS